MRRDCEIEVGDVDRAANTFAAYLLMPPELFDPIARDLDLLDTNRLEIIARKFRVPVGAVIWRLMLYAAEPCPS